MKYAFVLLALAACRPPGAATITHSASDDASAASTAPDKYVDVEDTLANGDETQFETWLGIRDRLHSDFDNICGDTHCGGDYSDLAPIKLRCSMDATSHVLKSCKYVFAGSYEVINAQTGSIRVTAKTFSCTIAVTNLTLESFMSTLSAAGNDSALQRQLGPNVRSVYDSLGDCL